MIHLSMKHGHFPYFAKLGILFAIYFSTAKIGLMMDAVSGFATLVWPPSGISLAALLLFGYRLWPAITLGAFLVNLLTGAPVLASCGIGIGNTLEALLGTYLLKRAGFRNSLDRLEDVLSLLGLAALFSTAVSATVGVSSLWLGGVISLSAFSSTWEAWWVGDILSNLVIAPFLLTWGTRLHTAIQLKRLAEAERVALSLVVVSLIVFWGPLSAELKNTPLPHMIFPLLIWASLRFGQRGAVTTTFAISVLAIWGTMQGFGPFIRDTLSESLFFLQTFMGVTAVTAMILAAVVAEQAQSEQKARESEERVSAIFSQAIVGIAETDLTGRFVLVNRKYCEIIARPMEEVLHLRMQDLIHPEDRSDCLILFERMAIGGQDFVVEMRYVGPDGSYLWVNNSVSIIRDPGGQPKYAVTILQDITERKHAEEQIKAAIREKEILLKEIHHRVKNNLQVISSLFHLQSRYIKDHHALELFKESQNRVRSIALIHEQLYRSKELSRIDFTEYIRNLTANLARTYGVHSDAVRLKVNANDVSLSVDTAISCGLIINELVSNSLKYAFPPGKDGEIQIDLRPAQDNQFILTVRDNGIGLPKDLDFRNTESLGLQLVTTLTDQLSGAIELDSRGGTAFRLVFKELKHKEGGQQNGKRADNGC